MLRLPCEPNDTLLLMTDSFAALIGSYDLHDAAGLMAQSMPAGSLKSPPTFSASNGRMPAARDIRASRRRTIQPRCCRGSKDDERTISSADLRCRGEHLASI